MKALVGGGFCFLGGLLIGSGIPGWGSLVLAGGMFFIFIEVQP